MYTIADMPLRGKNIWVVVVSSMEQIIGAGLSTVVGVIIPMIALMRHHELSPVMQGVVGSIGLVGIAIGSPIIGRLSDKHGYLAWFRICPLLIMVGSLIGWASHSVILLIVGLFIAGIGTGGGYSLDSAYIGELLPDKWRLKMVGLAKATCALGFIGVAVACWIWLDVQPRPEVWNRLMLIIAVMALATLLMRIHWAESPKWLIAQGRRDEALKAAQYFYGQQITLCPDPSDPNVHLSPSCAASEAAAEAGAAPQVAKTRADRWLNLKRAILCGVPWACEGLGVYGFGVFLPVLVMALGIDKSGAVGIHKVITSVEVTALVNFFILPGFVLGLLIMDRFRHVSMLGYGFIISAAGLLVLWLGYRLHLASWVMILGFVIFELALNAGPHLVTYILPTQAYPISERGAGSGLAAMNGKFGAIIGVVLMPLLLGAGGPSLVLIVSIGVMLLGALVTYLFRGVIPCKKEEKEKKEKINVPSGNVKS